MHNKITVAFYMVFLAMFSVGMARAENIGTFVKTEMLVLFLAGFCALLPVVFSKVLDSLVKFKIMTMSVSGAYALSVFFRLLGSYSVGIGTIAGIEAGAMFIHASIVILFLMSIVISWFLKKRFLKLPKDS